jgi:hypothetical protein
MHPTIRYQVRNSNTGEWHDVPMPTLTLEPHLLNLLDELAHHWAYFENDFHANMPKHRDRILATSRLLADWYLMNEHDPSE